MKHPQIIMIYRNPITMRFNRYVIHAARLQYSTLIMIVGGVIVARIMFIQAFKEKWHQRSLTLKRI